jgi:hypothetical protein
MKGDFDSGDQPIVPVTVIEKPQRTQATVDQAAVGLNHRLIVAALPEFRS